MVLPIYGISFVESLLSILDNISPYYGTIIKDSWCRLLLVSQPVWAYRYLHAMDWAIRMENLKGKVWKEIGT